MTSGSQLGSDMVSFSLQPRLVPFDGCCLSVSVLLRSLHLSSNLGMASLTACLFCAAGPHGAQRRSCCQPLKWHCICMQGTAAEVAVMTQELSRLADEMLPKGETAGDDSGEQGSLSQRLKASWDNKVGSVTLFEGVTCLKAQRPGSAAHCGASCHA